MGGSRPALAMLICGGGMLAGREHAGRKWGCGVHPTSMPTPAELRLPSK